MTGKVLKIVRTAAELRVDRFLHHLIDAGLRPAFVVWNENTVVIESDLGARIRINTEHDRVAATGKDGEFLFLDSAIHPAASIALEDIFFPESEIVPAQGSVEETLSSFEAM